MILRHHPKVHSCKTIAPFGDIPQWYRKIFFVDRTSSSILVVYFAWREKWPDTQVDSDSWAMANGLTRWTDSEGKLMVKKFGDKVRE